MSRILTILLLLFRARNYTGQERKFKDLKFIFVNGWESCKKIFSDKFSYCFSPDPNNFEYVELNETLKLLNHSNYDNDRPTMLYGYGYTEKYTSMSTQTVVSSYIERGDHNILVVEWSNYSGGNYLAQAIRNSYKVGEIVGKTLLEMQSSGFNLERFHLVGHSLGGHLVGYIGRSVKKNSNSTSQITRITALDPAGPLFYGYINYGSILNQPINKDDGLMWKFQHFDDKISSEFSGLFVDVIHTDTTFFGAPDQCGDVDFWPNAGRDQPECPPGGWDVYNEESKGAFTTVCGLTGKKFWSHSRMEF